MNLMPACAVALGLFQGQMALKPTGTEGAPVEVPARPSYHRSLEEQARDQAKALRMEKELQRLEAAGIRKNPFTVALKDRETAKRWRALEKEGVKVGIAHAGQNSNSYIRDAYGFWSVEQNYLAYNTGTKGEIDPDIVFIHELSHVQSSYRTDVAAYVQHYIDKHGDVLRALIRQAPEFEQRVRKLAFAEKRIVSEPEQARMAERYLKTQLMGVESYDGTEKGLIFGVATEYQAHLDEVAGYKRLRERFPEVVRPDNEFLASLSPEQLREEISRRLVYSYGFPDPLVRLIVNNWEPLENHPGRSSFLPKVSPLATPPKKAKAEVPAPPPVIWVRNDVSKTFANLQTIGGPERRQILEEIGRGPQLFRESLKKEVLEKAGKKSDLYKQMQSIPNFRD